MERPKNIVHKTWRVVNTKTNTWQRVGQKLIKSKDEITQWEQTNRRPVEDLINSKTRAIALL
jgi:hypothetical protein